MSPNHYKNILIIKHGSLGDIISSTSVMKSIKDNYNNSNIVLLTSTKYREFMRKSNLVNEILIDDRRGVFSSLNILFSIINAKFDLIVDLQNSTRTLCYGLFFRFFSSSKINGTHFIYQARYIYNRNSPPSVIKGLSNQVSLIGCKPNDKPYVSWLKLSNLYFQEINNKKFFLISPGCSIKHVQKKWPEQNYIDICRFLLSSNITPVLIGAREDKEVIDIISNEDDKILNLCNQSPLNVVYTLAVKAEGALSNDSGPAHLIAASGCKVHIILSSFSNPKTVIPQSNNVSFSQSDKIFQISSKEIIMQIKKILK